MFNISFPDKFGHSIFCLNYPQSSLDLAFITVSDKLFLSIVTWEKLYESNYITTTATMAWRDGNAFHSINEVTVRGAGLVLW